MGESSKPTRANVAHHATTVALTPARVVTSHLRRRYHRRYKGRYRFFRLVFAFDLFLVGAASVLFVFDASLFFHLFQSTSPGIRVTFVSPQLRASDTVPLQAKLIASDGKIHNDVSLRWNLPAWVDVISATPPLTPDGRVYFGRVVPNQDVESNILVHIKTVPGTPMPISFSLQQAGLFGFPRIDTGGESRVVQAGVLRVMPPIDVRNVVSEGSVPLVLSNSGATTSSLLTLRLDARDGAPDARFSSGGTSLVVQQLAPGEKRVLFVDVGIVNATSVHLAWDLQDGAQVVFTHEANYGVVPEGRVRITTPLKWIQGESTANVGYQNYVGSARAFVAHPYISSTEGPYQVVSLAQGNGQFSVLFSPTSTSRVTSEWSALPIDDSVPGSAYGIRAVGSVAATFPFRADARYYTALGDQIGIGPLPPRVGEKTSYWIVWTVGPTENDLKQLTLQTMLPLHVQASGSYTSTVQGTFQTNGNSVTWIIPSLRATGGEPVTFAFEVIAQPAAADVGSPMPLVGKSTAEALNASNNQQVEATANAETTDLPNDAKAKGKGVVTR